ncbi:MAG: bifunctional riboflavin kinase/FAD synthetase [Desulfobacterales bacterium]|nr:bifunctional riboflavin kinase/FAD synthetase [Desulfobacterales bacterium]
MELIEDINKIATPLSNTVVTIGNFDGVHIGHQALFRKVIEEARLRGGKAVAVTFEPHPVRVLKQNGLPPLITIYEQKIELIAQTGIDVLICIQFTPEFAALSPRAFVADLLIDRIGMKAIVVGEDYTFGKNREGDVALLKAYARQFDFKVITVGEIQTSTSTAQRISSTKIRDLVMEGDVDVARGLLGRNYQIRGVVITGRNRGGRQLGFPTANIQLEDELCPKNGIYAVTVECGGSFYPGVANIGYSPTFDDHQFTVEVYLIDFSGDLYGKHLRVNFVKRLRDEKRFGNLADLSAQIKQDVSDARVILAA